MPAIVNSRGISSSCIAAWLDDLERQPATRIDLACLASIARLRDMRRFIFLILLVLMVTPIVAVLTLRWIDPPFSLVMLQQQVGIWRSGEPERRIRHAWLPMREMGPHLPLAVVAAEDQRFPRHFGFDLDAIESAIENNLKGGPMRGASTLTQQVAKNLFLWQGRSWLRKGLEAGLTLLLEALWPKHRILEVYLNIAEWAPDHYGAAAAADYWFDRPPNRLTRRQAASLAAILPSPKKWRADPPSAYVKQRTRWIERQMLQLGDGWLDGVHQKEDGRIK